MEEQSITFDFGIPADVLREIKMLQERIAAAIYTVSLDTVTALKSSVPGRRRKGSRRRIIHRANTGGVLARVLPPIIKQEIDQFDREYGEQSPEYQRVKNILINGQ